MSLATQPRVRLCGCQLSKAKAVPVKTVVGRHVDAKEPKLAKRLEHLLTEHGNSVADKVAKLYGKKFEKADGIDALIASILKQLGLSEVSVDIVDAVTPQMVKSFEEAGVVGIAQVGIEATASMTEHLDAAALKYAESHGADLVKGLTATMEDDLRDAISSAVKNGWSTQELSQSIRDSFSFSKSRAGTIARTELATAHVQGNVQGWRETGQVEKKAWILGDLHDIEDECDDNAMAGAVGLDEDFPSGIAFPPAHPNCICDVLPVLSEGGA